MPGILYWNFTFILVVSGEDGEIKDSLEKAVLKLHKLSDLPSNASKVEIKNKIAEFDKELHGEKMTLTQNVPYKALSGFANKYSERIDLNSFLYNSKCRE